MLALLLSSRSDLGEGSEGSATLRQDKLAVSACLLSSSPAAKPNPKWDCGQEETSQCKCSWVLPRSRSVPGPILSIPSMRSRQAVAVEGSYLREVFWQACTGGMRRFADCNSSQGTTSLQKRFPLSIYQIKLLALC